MSPHGQPARPAHLDDGPWLSETLVGQARFDATRHTAGTTPPPSSCSTWAARQRPFPAQRRALAIRNRRCQGPGCDRTGHLDAHYIRLWGDNGPADLDNLHVVNVPASLWHAGQSE